MQDEQRRTKAIETLNELRQHSDTFKRTPGLTEAQRAWCEKMGVDSSRAYFAHASRDQEGQISTDERKRFDDLALMYRSREAELELTTGQSTRPTDSALKIIDEEVGKMALKNEQARWFDYLNVKIPKTEKLRDEAGHVSPQELKNQKEREEWAREAQARYYQ